MEAWLADPKLLDADQDAEYAAVIEINMDDVKEPISGLPNDPGRCEIHVGSQRHQNGRSVYRLVHDQHRPLPRGKGELLEGKSNIPVCACRLRQTKMDAQQLTEEGYYGILGRSGARMEMPGCFIVHGQPSQVREGATRRPLPPTSQPFRVETLVYLGSADCAAICSKLGKIPLLRNTKPISVSSTKKAMKCTVT